MQKLATASRLGFIIPSISLLPPRAPSLSLLCNATPNSLSSPTPTPPTIPKFWGLSIRNLHVEGMTIPDNKRVEYALQYIHGIGRARARQIVYEINMKNRFTRDLSQAEIESLRDAVSDYLIHSQLRRFNELAIKRLEEIHSYRGSRHSLGLPCRGQRTKTNAQICREMKRLRDLREGKK